MERIGVISSFPFIQIFAQIEKSKKKIEDVIFSNFEKQRELAAIPAQDSSVKPGEFPEKSDASDSSENLSRKSSSAGIAGELECEFFTKTVVEMKTSIEGVILYPFVETLFKVYQYVMNFFGFNFKTLDEILSVNSCAKLLKQKYIELIDPSKLEHIERSKNTEVPEAFQVALEQLHHLQMLRVQRQFVKFKKSIQTASSEELLAFYHSLPVDLKSLLHNLVRLRHLQDVEKAPHLLAEKQKGESSAFEELERILGLEKGEMFTPIDEEKLLAVIEKGQQVNALEAKEKEPIYEVSTESLEREFSKDILKKPITVTMVGIEYAGLVKQGGLAEAVEGLSQGIKSQHPENRVRLVFPKYSHLPSEVSQALKEPLVYKNKEEEFKVYFLEFQGVECFFIEDPSFTLSAEKPDIYGPTHQEVSLRCTRFSELAAVFLWEHKDTDVIHLHDWHVAGVGLKLKNDYNQAWQKGEIPPILFTYHNNNRCAQGRTALGPYNYDPVVKGLQHGGVATKNENLFVEMLSEVADGVTTVSETFGMESQQTEKGEGVSFCVRQAAKVGKLSGIINGVNTTRWNPKTDQQLLQWKDVETGEPLDLSFSSEDETLVEKKGQAKEQLALWVKKNKPKTELDSSKPLITYVGRFDSYQKGMESFEEAIQVASKHGGQLVFMGASEDLEAKRILDTLEKRYSDKVLFLRDYKDEKGRFYYQQGDHERPGIGSLVRAATDIVFVPSRFEPCGLVQFEAWLFGSLVVGAKTGGLADTIITQEKEAKRFNGFLFERGNPGLSLESAIISSLRFFQENNQNEKQSVLSRVMKEGKQYGWHRSPKGFTPVEKYRFTYENAKKWSHRRGSQAQLFYRIDDLARAAHLVPVKKSAMDAEEAYLRAYYQENVEPVELQRLYYQLHDSCRNVFPSPFGREGHGLAYLHYGAHCLEGKTEFCVFAPNAEVVQLALYDDSESLSTTVPMKREASGEWKVTVEGILPGQRYHYMINRKKKIDPYAQSFLPSENSKFIQPPFSVVSTSSFVWSDQAWMERREKEAGQTKPMSIFEFHPTTWRKKQQEPLNYKELVKELITHCKNYGYTHVEPMAILEHFCQDSLGYQVSGYFAQNYRMGSVDDLKYMINELHKNGIGIFLDWVPAHFASDDFGLRSFDGSPLLEASGFKHWFSLRKFFFSFGSKQFDFQKKNVREFLLSSAVYWMKEMHVDGFRVDCIRSFLFSEDLASATSFLQEFNAVVHEQFPGVVTIAEDYSGDTSVTQPFWKKGLGFDMKWHVSWLHGTLSYFETSLEKRSAHYEKIKKALQSDNFHKQVLALSHDSFSLEGLISLTKGLQNEAQQFANLKSILSFVMCVPGKKLFYMGSDTASNVSLKELLAGSKSPIDGIQDQMQKPLQQMLHRLHTLYRQSKAFWEFDDNGRDLEWIEDEKKKIHAYRRKSSSGESFVCLHNFTDKRATIKVCPTTEGKTIHQTVFDSNDYVLEGEEEPQRQRENGTSGYVYTVEPLSSLVIQELKEGEALPD